MTTPKDLIDQLVEHGGAIVASAECSDLELSVAAVSGRLAVNEYGLGFVRRPKEWLAIAKKREELHPNDSGQYSA